MKPTLNYRIKILGENIDSLLYQYREKLEKMSPDEVDSNGAEAVAGEVIGIVEDYSTLLAVRATKEAKCENL